MSSWLAIQLENYRKCHYKGLQLHGNENSVRQGWTTCAIGEFQPYISFLGPQKSFKNLHEGLQLCLFVLIPARWLSYHLLITGCYGPKKKIMAAQVLWIYLGFSQIYRNHLICIFGLYYKYKKTKVKSLG